MTGYRYACPHDHRTVTTRGGHAKGPATHWYCKTCNERYAEVTDLKTGLVVSP